MGGRAIVEADTDPSTKTDAGTDTVADTDYLTVTEAEIDTNAPSVG